MCESIVHPVTHVIIPPRPLSSCTSTSLPTLNYGVSPPSLSRVRPMSMHSAPAAVDRELNERVGDPRIGHAISARGYRVVRVQTVYNGRSIFENPETERSENREAFECSRIPKRSRRFRNSIVIFPHSKISNIPKHLELCSKI